MVTLQENLKQLESNREKAAKELKDLQESTTPLDVEVKEKEKIKSECVKKNRYVCIVRN